MAEFIATVSGVGRHHQHTPKGIFIGSRCKQWVDTKENKRCGLQHPWQDACGCWQSAGGMDSRRWMYSHAPLKQPSQCCWPQQRAGLGAQACLLFLAHFCLTSELFRPSVSKLPSSAGRVYFCGLTELLLEAARWGEVQGELCLATRMCWLWACCPGTALLLPQIQHSRAEYSLSISSFPSTQRMQSCLSLSPGFSATHHFATTAKCSV